MTSEIEKTETKHPLYPYGAITTLEELNATIAFQGYKKPLTYVDAQNIINRSYSETNSGKSPKFLASRLATQYLQQFAIEEIIEETGNYDCKTILDAYVEALKSEHPRLKTLTEKGLTVHIRAIHNRVEFLVMDGKKSLYGKNIII